MACRRVVWFSAIAVMAGSFQAAGADRLTFFNLTTSTTFSGVYLAPAGTNRWGTNQALNDKDKEVDPSERLVLRGIARGRYDARLVDKSGRTCVRFGIDLSKDTSFDIRDNDLAGCTAAKEG
jgi:hypothetical protein